MMIEARGEIHGMLRKFALPTLFGLACCLGTTCTNLGFIFPAPTTNDVTITHVRTGCSEVSRSVHFSASSTTPGLTFQWFFPDGTTKTGSKVLFTFDVPGFYEVGLLAGGNLTRTRIEVPVKGEDDGEGDPWGDRCVPNEGNRHVDQEVRVQYATNPPASGPHYSVNGLAPAIPQLYRQPIRPERWVHNLEHGYVVVLFDCESDDCPESLFTNLQAFFDAAPLSKFNKKKLVITRYRGLQVPIMAIAWDVQRDFQEFDMNGLLDFYRLRVDRGPEDEP
jgi:hypothetical protein